MKPMRFKFRCVEIRTGEDGQRKPTYTLILAPVSSDYFDPTVHPSGSFQVVVCKETGLKVGDEVWLDMNGVVGN